MSETCHDGRPLSTLVPMVGRRFGQLLVLARVPPPPGSWRAPCVRVQCDCGEVFVARAQRVRDGVTRRCLACAQRAAAAHSREQQSVKLPSGRTIAEVAQATGIALDTVYQRWHRGWPESDLALPVLPSRRPRPDARFRKEAR